MLVEKTALFQVRMFLLLQYSFTQFCLFVCLFVCCCLQRCIFGDCFIAIVSARAVVGLHCLFNAFHSFSVFGILCFVNLPIFYFFFCILTPLPYNTIHPTPSPCSQAVSHQSFQVFQSRKLSLKRAHSAYIRNAAKVSQQEGKQTASPFLKQFISAANKFLRVILNKNNSQSWLASMLRRGVQEQIEGALEVVSRHLQL